MGETLPDGIEKADVKKLVESADPEFALTDGHETCSPQLRIENVGLLSKMRSFLSLVTILSLISTTSVASQANQQTDDRSPKQKNWSDYIPHTAAAGFVILLGKHFLKPLRANAKPASGLDESGDAAALKIEKTLEGEVTRRINILMHDRAGFKDPFISLLKNKPAPELQIPKSNTRLQSEAISVQSPNDGANCELNIIEIFEGDELQVGFGESVFVIFFSPYRGITQEDTDWLADFVLRLEGVNIPICICITGAETRSETWKQYILLQLDESRLFEILGSANFHVRFLGQFDFQQTSVTCPNDLAAVRSNISEMLARFLELIIAEPNQEMKNIIERDAA